MAFPINSTKQIAVASDKRRRSKFALNPEDAVEPTGSDANALVVFDFANGDTLDSPSINSIGFAWSGSKPLVTASNGRTGILFRYGPDAPFSDSSSELRYELNGQYEETYEKVTIVWPDNFRHSVVIRATIDGADDITAWVEGDSIQSGTGATATVFAVVDQYLYLENATSRTSDSAWGSGAVLTNTTQSLSATSTGRLGDSYNNKLSYQWAGSYSNEPATSYGMMGFEYQPDYAYSQIPLRSDLNAKVTRAANGTQSTAMLGSSLDKGFIIDPAVDNGQELELVFRRKRGTGLDANDAIAEAWKNAALKYGRYNLALWDEINNFFERGYLMGWSNSGFKEQTDFVITKYEFYGPHKPSGIE